MDLGRPLQPVRHQIEIAILIEIGQSHAVPNSR